MHSVAFLCDSTIFMYSVVEMINMAFAYTSRFHDLCIGCWVVWTYIYLSGSGGGERFFGLLLV